MENKNIFKDVSKETTSGIYYKNLMLKRTILTFIASCGEKTIADIGAEFNTSAPTITKLLMELLDEGYLVDLGKVETTGGRRPNVYGLNPSAAFFVGADVHRSSIIFSICDLKKNTIETVTSNSFKLDNTEESFENLLAEITKFLKKLSVDKSRIFGLGISLSGRVNSKEGKSMNYFSFFEEPLDQILESKLGIKTYLENDSRAMAYAECTDEVSTDKKNILFINLSMGIGLGMIIDGELYYGKSGFAGEFGHIPFFDNNQICQCGKRGCLETETSGYALERIVTERIQEGANTSMREILESGKVITVEDVINAVHHEDVLAIELLAEMGEKLGRGISTLINIFNPEKVIIGGALSKTGDYIKLPIRSAINKYSLNIVNKDTKISLSELGLECGAIGMSQLVRAKVLDLVEKNDRVVPVPAKKVKKAKK